VRQEGIHIVDGEPIRLGSMGLRHCLHCAPGLGAPARPEVRHLAALLVEQCTRQTKSAPDAGQATAKRHCRNSWPGGQWPPSCQPDPRFDTVDAIAHIPN
jgi:hypothetical protein